jgi:hypothetical protein
MKILGVDPGSRVTGFGFQIRSIPTLMIFREKVAIFSQPGAMSGADLEAVITKAQALDMDKVHANLLGNFIVSRGKLLARTTPRRPKI